MVTKDAQLFLYFSTAATARSVYLPACALVFIIKGVSLTCRIRFADFAFLCVSFEVSVVCFLADIDWRRQLEVLKIWV